MRKEKSPYVTISTMSITSSKFFFKSLFSESVRVGTLMEKWGPEIHKNLTYAT